MYYRQCMPYMFDLHMCNDLKGRARGCNSYAQFAFRLAENEATECLLTLSCEIHMFKSAYSHP